MADKTKKKKSVAGFLELAGKFTPDVAIILGSGLGDVAKKVEPVSSVSYGEIRGFSKAMVDGHAGELVLGKMGGKRMAVFCGRFHCYQGLSPHDTTATVRLAAGLGARILFATNAAGGISERLKPGDLMMIDDHINFVGNPLVGVEKDGQPMFLDMTEAYSKRLRTTLATAARREKITLKRGVYLACSGPSYETPAEVRAFGRLGADAIGMSTAPEVVMARSLGMEVCGLSCITNYAAGRTKRALSHEEVLDTTKRVQDKVARLVERFLQLL